MNCWRAGFCRFKLPPLWVVYCEETLGQPKQMLRIVTFPFKKWWRPKDQSHQNNGGLVPFYAQIWTPIVMLHFLVAQSLILENCINKNIYIYVWWLKICNPHSDNRVHNFHSSWQKAVLNVLNALFYSHTFGWQNIFSPPVINHGLLENHENPAFIDDVPLQTSIYSGFSRGFPMDFGHVSPPSPPLTQLLRRAGGFKVAPCAAKAVANWGQEVRAWPWGYPKQ